MMTSNPIAVQVRPVTDDTRNSARGATTDTLEEDLRRARVFANWMDAEFSIAGFRFGADAIIGLIPGVGDTLTSLAGFYLVYLARKHRLGRWVEWRMVGNLAIDWLAGVTPVVGDLVDAAFKANLRNLAILEQAVARQRGGAGETP